MKSAVAVAFFALACASESAVEECEALVAKYCKLETTCRLPPGRSEEETKLVYDQAFQACMSSSRTRLACGDAESVSGDYERCLAELDGLTCTPPFGLMLDAPPTSCIGVIQLK